MNDEQQTARFKFPRTRRLRSSLDFQRVYALKKRAGDEKLLIFAAKNEIGITRIGLSVSKKNGNSVVRHRIRRLLKEAFRLEQHQVPEGLDLILIPRPDSDASLEDYRNSIVTLSQRLSDKNR